MPLPRIPAKTRPVTLRLAATDIDMARALAAQKGIGYQTYVKMLLHEALRREAGNPGGTERWSESLFWVPPCLCG